MNGNNAHMNPGGFDNLSCSPPTDMMQVQVNIPPVQHATPGLGDFLFASVWAVGASSTLNSGGGGGGGVGGGGGGHSPSTNVNDGASGASTYDQPQQDMMRDINSRHYGSPSSLVAPGSSSWTDGSTPATPWNVNLHSTTATAPAYYGDNRMAGSSDDDQNVPFPHHRQQQQLSLSPFQVGNNVGGGSTGGDLNMMTSHSEHPQDNRGNNNSSMMATAMDIADDPTTDDATDQMGGLGHHPSHYSHHPAASNTKLEELVEGRMSPEHYNEQPQAGVHASAFAGGSSDDMHSEQEFAPTTGLVPDGTRNVGVVNEVSEAMLEVFDDADVVLDPLLEIDHAALHVDHDPFANSAEGFEQLLEGGGMTVCEIEESDLFTDTLRFSAPTPLPQQHHQQQKSTRNVLHNSISSSFPPAIRPRSHSNTPSSSSKSARSGKAMKKKDLGSAEPRENKNSRGSAKLPEKSVWLNYCAAVRTNGKRGRKDMHIKYQCLDEFTESVTVSVSELRAKHQTFVDANMVTGEDVHVFIIKDFPKLKKNGSVDVCKAKKDNVVYLGPLSTLKNETLTVRKDEMISFTLLCEREGCSEPRGNHKCKETQN